MKFERAPVLQGAIEMGGQATSAEDRPEHADTQD